jgi:hypothetical protein
MKMFGRSLVLALLLATAGGAIAQSTPAPTGGTQTGTDPVPTPPPSQSNNTVTMVIFWLGVVL